MIETNIPLAQVKDYSVRFPLAGGAELVALNSVSFDIHPGEAVGIVGESGSGKSMLGFSMLGLVPPPGRPSGSIAIDGIEVVGAPSKQVRRLRGSTVGLILQDPTASLNPLRTVRSQMCESLRLVGVSRDEQDDRIRDGLKQVGLDDERLLRRRPFELSGGQNQRIAIAMSLLQEPRLLIADEPTTALDVVVQLEVLALLRSLQAERNMALMLISHDLAVVDQLVDRIFVMYGGRLVERGAAVDIVQDPVHPYSRALLGSMPTLSVDQDDLVSIPGQSRAMLSTDAGCPFADRCDMVCGVCSEEFPERRSIDDGHDVWCHRTSVIEEVAAK